MQIHHMPLKSIMNKDHYRIVSWKYPSITDCNWWSRNTASLLDRMFRKLQEWVLEKEKLCFVNYRMDFSLGITTVHHYGGSQTVLEVENDLWMLSSESFITNCLGNGTFDLTGTVFLFYVCILKTCKSIHLWFKFCWSCFKNW